MKPNRLLILLSREGWKYLLEKPYRGNWSWEMFFCRLKGHPNGIVFYNPRGSEPDDRCIDCGEHIG